MQQTDTVKLDRELELQVEYVQGKISRQEYDEQIQVLAAARENELRKRGMLEE